MKHYLSAVAALFLGSTAATNPFTIPLDFNRTSGHITSRSMFTNSDDPDKQFKMLLDTKFEYLLAYTKECQETQQVVLGGGKRRLDIEPPKDCPGTAKIDTTNLTALSAETNTEIQWINPIQLYLMTGKYYNVEWCPEKGNAACKQFDTFMTTELKNSKQTNRYPLNGFIGLAPQPDEGDENYKYNFLKQLLEGQSDQVFSIFVTNDKDNHGEMHDAELRVGGYDLAKHAADGVDESHVKWLNDNQKDYYWSVSLNNAYLYDGDEREAILNKGPHSVIFSTQQKDISTTFQDYKMITANLERHGVMIQTEEHYFRCTDDLLHQLPDLQLEFKDAVTGDLVNMNLPWQGYVEVIEGGKDLCQLRINFQSFDWQIGTWARRQIYTIYRIKDKQLQMALIDSAQKEVSGRNSHAKYVRIAIIFVVSLASLFVIFSVACCIKKYIQNNSPKEVTFATQDDEQQAKLNNIGNMNASQDETIEEDANTKQ